MATARGFAIEADDLQSSGGGAYAALEVPNDYEAVLMSVEDYDYRDRGKSNGWIFNFEIEELPFKVYVAFSKAARWKLLEVFGAFDENILMESSNLELDPDLYVGRKVGAHVDFDKSDEEWDENSPRYREIKYVFALPTLDATL